ncbi:MAG: hypothetical protein J6Z79_03285 [Clostridia bacterium]|nr:hypothetical protein [Clostridia bacterium]
MKKIEKKNWIIGGVAAAVLLVGAVLIFYFYSIRPLDLYGQTVRADAAEYTLTENVKIDLDDLIAALSQLTRLKKLDLGPYQVEVRETDKLRAAFPNAELTYLTYVSLYGDRVLPDTAALDLSDRDLSDLTQLREALPYLKNLKEVQSTGTVIPRKELDALRKDFPGVTFKMVSSVEAFGSTLHDNITSLDLKSKSLDVAALKEGLALLPALEEVDLRGQRFTPEEQLELAKAFPEVAFGWEVELAGQTYDSYTEDLDLSGRKGITTALIRERAPLFPKMTRLDMSDCGIDNEEMAALRADLPGVKVVWRLHLGQWSLKTDAVAFSVLIYNYNHKRLTSKDIEVLKYCTDLQALDLGHQAVTDISVIGDYLPELRILILVDNAVSDLTPVAKLKHLHYIELFVNSIQLDDLSPLAACKELVDVNVSYLYSVTDFSPLFDLPLLERLWMEHTKVSADQLNTLRERYPNATIITQGTGSIDQGWRVHERYDAMIWMYHHPDECKDLAPEFKKYDR